MDDFYSQAFNFATAVQGGVDMRTGLFNISIPLLQIHGNDNLGPTLPLALSYTPLNAVDAGLGIGWTLGLSRYDRKARRLSLSSGEQYMVQESPDSASLRQQKLDSLRFEKRGDGYRVLRKTGEVEILSGPDLANDIKVPLKLYSPLGHQLELEWDLTRSPPRLLSVRDERQHVFLRIAYPDGGTRSQTTLQVWPDTVEAYEITLSFQNGYLKQLRHGGAEPALDWTFDYESVGGRNLITKITAPTGMVQRALYQRDMQRFPSASPLKTALPAVKRYIQQPGAGQPDLVTDYAYSSYNYLGYGGQGGAWKSDSDYLYGVLTGYEYWCRATTGDRRVTQHYNSFHLLVRVETQEDGCETLAETQYYAEKGTPFEQQPKQFQLPKRVQTTYRNDEDQTRTEETLTEFDAHGNPTRRLTPDGTLTQWEYYPGEGEGEAGMAPAEPNGLVRLLKQQSVLPPQDLGPTPLRATQYRYAAIATTPRSHGDVASPAAVQVREDTLADGRLLASRTTAYQADAASQELGRILRIQDSLPARDGPYVNTHEFSFVFDGDQSIQTVDYRTHDGLVTRSGQVQSRWTGRVWSATDAQGNGAQYKYDRLGRLTRSLRNPGTSYESINAYRYLEDEDGLPVTLAIDPAGNQTRTLFDGLGRQIRQEQKARDAQAWTPVSTQGYDDRGRLSATTAWDAVPRDGGAPRALQATQTRTYDGWGQVESIAHSNGYRLLTRYDPVARSAETRLDGEGQGSRRTRYNAQGKPVRIERLDAAGAVDGVIVNDYNGLGWLIRNRDELGRETRYKYDDWGRPILVTLPDGAKVARRYAPDATGADAIASIEVNGASQGTQRFDGLGRRRSSSNGQRQYAYDYDRDCDPAPSRVTGPDGTVIRYDYIAALDNAVGRVSVGDCVQTFDYDPAMGWLTGADEAGSGYRNGYAARHDTLGLLCEETFSGGTASVRVASGDYTANGLPLSYVDVSEAAESWDYDDMGRPARLRNSHVDIALRYDALGRVHQRDVTDRQTGAALTLTLDYDEFNRESGRELKSGGETWKIHRRYHANGQLRERETWRGTLLARREQYEYDARNRLQRYQCIGDASHLPRDPYGKPISQQTFRYDAVDNIVECRTEFDGGSDTALFLYDSTDTNQLAEVRHSHPAYPPSIKLDYDHCGRLIRDEAGRRLGYDPLGRLASVEGGGVRGASYRYNALNQLVAQLAGPDDTRDLYYRDGSLANEIRRESGHKTRYIRAGASCVAQRRDGTGAGAGTTLLGTDAQRSVILAQQDGATRACAYSPYGHRPASDDALSALGYNGERVDPVSGAYHLGNGYRAYNPVLMRFNAPDSLSPFGAGGINPYAYCVGDPINRGDPSGHLSWQAWLGIGLGIVGIVATVATFGVAAAPLLATEGVAAAATAGISAVGVVGGLGLAADVTAIVGGALESASPTASAILGWSSLAFGLPGMITGAASLVRAAGRLLPAAGEAAGETARVVHGVQTETDHLVTLGGEARNFRHYNEAGTGGIGLFEDSPTIGRTQGRRLNVVSHGIPGMLRVQTANSTWTSLTAPSLARLLERSVPDLAQYDSVRVIACSSATPTESGATLGQGLANLLRRDVEAYHGPVRMDSRMHNVLVDASLPSGIWHDRPTLRNLNIEGDRATFSPRRAGTRAEPMDMS